MTTAEFIILLLAISISCSLIGQLLHSSSSYGDLLPPVGKWSSCANLPETCDVPEYEGSSLSDLLIYRFENGTMIVKDISGSPIVK